MTTTNNKKGEGVLAGGVALTGLSVTGFTTTGELLYLVPAAAGVGLCLYEILANKHSDIETLLINCGLSVKGIWV